MKKLFSVLLMLVLVVSIFTACAGGDKNASNDGATGAPANNESNEGADDRDVVLKDGIYTAEEADFADSGWKDNVTIEVKDGEITSVDWNSTHKEQDKDKKTASKDGSYGMVANGGAIAEWHEQAEKVEAFLVEKQDVNAIQVKDDGKTDAIAGVTINVNGFVDMVKDALSNAK
ncbi:MAG: FMN-binding protein [Clostridiales bacterium]|nr:FMN-binding protein [Clostridiales bacterium]